MKLKLLVSPLARAAYFADYLDVATAEYRLHYPGADVQAEPHASMVFLRVEAGQEQLAQLARLSFVQGIFEDQGDRLALLDQDPRFLLPADLVYGAKYQGKTNELVTQLAINVGLVLADLDSGGLPHLLDPMAGRGTTLLWALRYGMHASGIEQDRRALDDLQRHVKRQTKLHRIEHRQSQGYVGKRNKQELGRFRQYEIAGRTLRLTTGDSREADRWAQHKRFHLLVADLPYGVKHLTAGRTRNPLDAIAECAPAWAEALRPGGAMVLVFNSYQPKRSELLELFVAQGLAPQDFSAPHRMSESILRDLVAFKKP